MCSLSRLKSASTSSTSRDPGTTWTGRITPRSVKVSGRLAVDLEQVFGEHDADDVVDGLVVDRIAREAVLVGVGERLGEGRLDGDGDDLGARRHHLAGVLLGELEDAFDEGRVLAFEGAAFLALFDEESELLGRVDAFLGRGFPSLAERAEDEPGRTRRGAPWPA